MNTEERAGWVGELALLLGRDRRPAVSAEVCRTLVSHVLEVRGGTRSDAEEWVWRSVLEVVGAWEPLPEGVVWSEVRRPLLAAAYLLGVEKDPGKSDEVLPGLGMTRAEAVEADRLGAPGDPMRALIRQQLAAMALGWTGDYKLVSGAGRARVVEIASAVLDGVLAKLGSETATPSGLTPAPPGVVGIEPDTRRPAAETHSPAGGRRVSRRGALVATGAVVASVGVVIAVARSDNDEGRESGGAAPVRVEARLPLTDGAPFVLASVVREGQPTELDGCAVLDELPEAWDPVCAHGEVYFVLRAVEPNVVMTEIHLAPTFEKGEPRVQLVCEGGGNGAPSGWRCVDDGTDIRVEPEGPGAVEGRMRLFLDPTAEEPYRIAVWFNSLADRVTTWKGTIRFRYGNEGDRTYDLPFGPFRTTQPGEGTTAFEAVDNVWRQTSPSN